MCRNHSTQRNKSGGGYPCLVSPQEAFEEELAECRPRSENDSAHTGFLNDAHICPQFLCKGPHHIEEGIALITVEYVECFHRVPQPLDRPRMHVIVRLVVHEDRPLSVHRPSVS
jgi:hypothetical protein